MANPEFKDFRIGNLFDVLLSAGDNKPSELPKGNIPLVSAGNTNNGIVAYVSNGDKKSQLFKAGHITVDMFGKAYYQPKGFYSVSHGRVNILKSKAELSKEASVFIVSSLRHLGNKYSFSLMLTSKRLADEVVALPATDAGEPDFVYMADYIKQIQADYIKQIQANNIKQIQAYLQATGLTDITLTDEERGALTLSPYLKGFKLKDLFDIAPSKAYKDMSGFKSGNTPFVSNTSVNNGIVNYFDKIANNPSNIITFSDTTDSDKTFFYQPKAFIGFAHIQAMQPKFEGINEYIAMFMIAKMKKAIKGKYSYGTKFNRNIANETVIELPIDPTGELDLAYMETYIRATQKQVIENLAEWNLKNIEALNKLTNC